MTALTDPAKELSDIANRLMDGSSKNGATYLADKFGVEPWSTEFFKVIACIFERADQVAAVLKQSRLDEDTINTAIEDITAFKAAFTAGSLNSSWNTAGQGLTAMRDHGKRLGFFQDTVRAVVNYPKLTDEEIREFISLIDAYLSELKQSADEHPFVRQAICDGLTAFQFQLRYIGWMGTGYALMAFREVIFVYDASTSFYQQQDNPDAGAFLRGMGSLIKTIKTKIDEAKSYSDAASFVIDTYRLASAVGTPLLLANQLRLTGPG
jgi:hypothetical protein